MDIKTYVVPHDFSSVADAATQHALNLARQTKARIILLHIIKSESEGLKAQQKFAKVLDDLKLQGSDPEVSIKIVVGSIFEDIGKIAEENKASLVIMGTHGARGMQKVFGSYALKVITSSGTPFLIVQESEPPTRVGRVVLPVDLSKESLQIMNVAVDIAKTYDSEVHIIGKHESDSSLALKMKAHITVVRKTMAREGVKSHVELLKGGGAFHQLVMNYSASVNADMIAIAYHTESLLPQFDRFAQSLITNDAHIPVLIVNSKDVSSLYF